MRSQEFISRDIGNALVSTVNLKAIRSIRVRMLEFDMKELTDFLQRRTALKRASFDDCDFTGVHLPEKAKDYAMAAQKLLSEQTGLEISVMRPSDGSEGEQHD